MFSRAQIIRQNPSRCRLALSLARTSASGQLVWGFPISRLVMIFSGPYSGRICLAMLVLLEIVHLIRKPFSVIYGANFNGADISFCEDYLASPSKSGGWCNGPGAILRCWLAAGELPSLLLVRNDPIHWHRQVLKKTHT